MGLITCVDALPADPIREHAVRVVQPAPHLRQVMSFNLEAMSLNAPAPGDTAVERTWNKQASQGQILALA